MSVDTHHFRGVNIVSVYANLENGLYDSLQIKPLTSVVRSPLRVSDNDMTLTSRITTIHSYPGFNEGTVRYMCRSRNGNLPQYGEITEADENEIFHCMYCIRSHQYKYSVGIPIGKSNDGTYRLVDVFCNIRCALAELANRESMRRVRLDYSNSRNLLREMCSRSNLNLDEIMPAPCKSLLKIFNGPLDHDQFADSMLYTLDNTIPRVFLQNQLDYFIN